MRRIEFDTIADHAARLDLCGHSVGKSGERSWYLHPSQPNTTIQGVHVTLSGSYIIVTGDVQTCVFLTKEDADGSISWLANRQTRDVVDSAAQGMSDTEYLLVEDLDARVAASDLDWIAERLEHRSDIRATIARAMRALSGRSDQSAVIEAQDLVTAGCADVDTESICKIGKVTSRRVHVANAAVLRVWSVVQRDVERGMR